MHLLHFCNSAVNFTESCILLTLTFWNVLGWHARWISIHQYPINSIYEQACIYKDQLVFTKISLYLRQVAIKSSLFLNFLQLLSSLKWSMQLKGIYILWSYTSKLNINIVLYIPSRRQTLSPLYIWSLYFRFCLAVNVLNIL